MELVVLVLPVLVAFVAPQWAWAMIAVMGGVGAALVGAEWCVRPSWRHGMAWRGGLMHDGRADERQDGAASAASRWAYDGRAQGAGVAGRWPQAYVLQ